MTQALLALMFIFSMQSALASLPSQRDEHPSQEVELTEYRTSKGFVVNNENHKIICQFNRDISPNSFPSFTTPPPPDEGSSEGHDDIPTCGPAQLRLSENYAQNLHQQVAVAALPAIAGAAVCAVGFADGFFTALSVGEFVTYNKSNGKDWELDENIGGESLMWWTYNSLVKKGSNEILLAGFKQIIRLNLLCSGAGLGAGAATYGIIYLTK